MRTRQLKHTNKIPWYLLFLLFSTVLLLTVPFLRLAQENPYAPGEETYIHLNAIQTQEDFSTISFFEYTLFQLTNIFSYKTLAFFFGLVLGLLTLTFFLIYVKRYTKSTKEQFLAGLLLLLTPGFIMGHIGITSYSLLLLLSILALCCYSRKNNLFYIFLGLITLLNFTVGILAFALLLLKEILGKQYKKTIFSSIALLLTLLAGFLLPFKFINFSWALFSANLNEIFFFFGGTYGYPLFLFIVSVVGIYLYAQVKISTPVKVIISLGLVLSLFYEPVRLLLLLPLALYGAKSFTFLLGDKWQINYLHQLTVILLLCILVFSVTSVVTEGVVAFPTVEQVQAFSFIGDLHEHNNFLEQGSVLTDERYGAYLTYFSTLQAYTQETDVQSKQTAQQLYASRDSQYVTQTMQKEHIALVLVDEPMLTGRIWQRPDEGLLFVMNYNEQFKKLYNKGTTSIYYYTQWEGKENNSSTSS